MEQIKLIEGERITGTEIPTFNPAHGRTCGPIILQLHEWAVKHRVFMLEAIKKSND